MQIVFRAKSKSLPDCVQKFFPRYRRANIIREVLVQKDKERAKKQNKKRTFITIVGVKLWSEANISLKMCNLFLVFERKVYDSVNDFFGCDFFF